MIAMLIVTGIRFVEGSIVVVVVHVLINDDNRMPCVEEVIGDNCTKRGTADDVAAIDIAAEVAVIEVVGSVVVIYGACMRWNMRVMVTEAVAIGVRVWMVAELFVTDAFTIVVLAIGVVCACGGG